MEVTHLTLCMCTVCLSGICVLFGAYDRTVASCPPRSTIEQVLYPRYRGWRPFGETDFSNDQVDQVARCFLLTWRYSKACVFNSSRVFFLHARDVGQVLNPGTCTVCEKELRLCILFFSHLRYCNGCTVLWVSAAMFCGKCDVWARAPKRAGGVASPAPHHRRCCKKIGLPFVVTK